MTYIRTVPMNLRVFGMIVGIIFKSSVTNQSITDQQQPEQGVETHQSHTNPVIPFRLTWDVVDQVVECDDVKYGVCHGQVKHLLVLGHKQYSL